MQAIARWSVDDAAVGPDAPAEARFLADHGQASNKPDSISPPLRSFTPRSVRTLMSDDSLGRHGLRVSEVAAQAWLVSIDADMLVTDCPSAAWLQSLTTRLDDLAALAAEEEMPFNPYSAIAALSFAREINAARQPGVFLIGNGNIRLLWTEGTEQIGLQFRGDAVIQYVMMAQRDARLSTHMGDDNSDGILRQISAAGLRHLLDRR